MSFKQEFSKEERKQESERIQSKYEDRIPVIVERGKSSSVPDIDKASPYISVPFSPVISLSLPTLLLPTLLLLTLLLLILLLRTLLHFSHFLRTLPEQKKYLVPSDLTCGQFLYVVRKRLKIGPTEAIYLFTQEGTIPSSSSLMADLYQEQKDDDGFLYLLYSGENVFG